MAWLPIVYHAGLLQNYHDIWSCVPSLLACQVAVTRLHTPDELVKFQHTAAHALVDQKDVRVFEELWRADDPFEEIYIWLRERAYLHKLEIIETQLFPGGLRRE